MKTKHTPTPWAVKGMDVFGPDMTRIVFTPGAAPDDRVTAKRLANAQFIVRAVNCHEEAFKLLHLLVLNGQIGGNFLKEAVRLIAKAEGK